MRGSLTADLFAAGYGSFDAQRQGTGAVLCFSLKDPATPAFERQTPSGIPALTAAFSAKQSAFPHKSQAFWLHNSQSRLLSILMAQSELRLC